VLPVVPDFSHLDRAPNRLVADQFDDEWTNILFVGRVIANKKIEDLIRFFHAYQTLFNPRSRLLIVGSYGGFERYLASLNQLVAALGASNVHFVGQVSDEELVGTTRSPTCFSVRASTRGSVCAGRVLLQADPGAGVRVAAVPATMDGAGVLYEHKDPGHVAALMDAIVSNCSLQDRIVDAQLAAVGRLQAKDFAATLARFVDQILAAPRAPKANVAFDFWQQFDDAIELEELRLYRPAIYQALGLLKFRIRNVEFGMPSSFSIIPNSSLFIIPNSNCDDH